MQRFLPNSALGIAGLDYDFGRFLKVVRVAGTSNAYRSGETASSSK
jgi:hypothetical protein